MDPGPADVPTAAVAAARADRTRAGFAPLHGDREGAAGGDVVHAVPRAAVPAGARGAVRRGIPRRQLAAPRARPFRSRGEPIYRESEGPGGSLTQKVDSGTTSLALKGV